MTLEAQSAGAIARPSFGRRATRIARRVASFLATLAVTFVGLTAVTFFISRLTKIDPVLAVVGDKATPQAYDQAYHALGLDQPLVVQYLIYLKRVVSGDFGMSVLTSQPVLVDLLRVFPATLELSTVAIIIGVLIGVPAGVVAGARKGGWQDQVIRVVCLFGYSVPVFWLGLIGLFVFYGELGGWLGPARLDVFYEGEVTGPTGIMLIDAALGGNWDIFGNALSHLILPASILGYFSLAYIARMTRSFMIDQLGQEYVIAARIKGNSYWQAVWRHAFPNIMVPLITVVGLSYASLLEGAVLTETVFAWPGLGLYITQALFSSDMNAVLGGTNLIGAVFITINLVCDLLYKLFDPRLRTSLSDLTLGQWLMSEAPTSRRQAVIGNTYRSARAVVRNPTALAGLVVVVLLLLAAIFAPWLSLGKSPLAQDLAGRLAPPSAAHWFGTDELGRDIMARTLYGARVTLTIVVLVSVIVVPIGLAMGTVAGYRGGWVDRVLMRITDVFMAFPRLVLALAFAAALGPGINNAVVAIALTTWPPYARIARSETLAIAHSDFIQAAVLEGASTWRILFRHIVPLCLSSVIVRLTLDMAGIILTAAGLGFLGLGAQPPTPEWGEMVSSGRDVILDQWWVATIPGLAIFVVSLGFNLLGDGLRDVFDPKSS